MALVRYFGNSLLAVLLAKPVFAQYTPQEISLNSGRPTFYDPSTSIAGKIALEEHVGNDLLSGLFTTPYYPNTNEPQWQEPIYLKDVAAKMVNIDSRVANMDAANISISVLGFGSPGIQGIFNATYATYAAGYVNDYMSTLYKNGNYSGRFEFWCKQYLSLQYPEGS